MIVRQFLLGRKSLTTNAARPCYTNPRFGRDGIWSTREGCQTDQQQTGVTIATTLGTSRASHPLPCPFDFPHVPVLNLSVQRAGRLLTKLKISPRWSIAFATPYCFSPDKHILSSIVTRAYGSFSAIVDDPAIQREISEIVEKVQLLLIKKKAE